MKIFVSDLDGTLLFSHRHLPSQEGEPCLCVEYLREKEQSFMTQEGAGFLCKLAERIPFIPLTTRSRAQYERLAFPCPRPALALVSNGGVLLENGKPDPLWYEESLSLLGGSENELQRGFQLMKMAERQGLIEQPRLIDGLFCCAVSREAEKAAQALSGRLDAERITLVCMRRKVYLLPVILTKGRALERLRRRFGSCQIVAAGDSFLDFSMLAAADTAFLPQAALSSYQKFGGNNASGLPGEPVAFTRAVPQAAYYHFFGLDAKA